MTNDEERKGTLDDEALESLLESADPVADEQLDIPSKRLLRLWNELDLESRDSQAFSTKQGVTRFLAGSARFHYVAVALAAAILLAGSMSWWRLTDTDSVISQAQHESKLQIREIEPVEVAPQNQTQSHGTTSLPRSVTIASIDQLLSMHPRERFGIINAGGIAGSFYRLDEQSLKDELGRWLAAWRVTPPDQRVELEAEWNRNRAFWLPWVRNWCGLWETEELNLAAVEVVVNDQKHAAVPYLYHLLLRNIMREKVWGHLCQLATIEQLRDLLPMASNCDEIQVATAALIRDGSPPSTDLLIEIASHPECRDAIKRVNVQWPIQHSLRCWTKLVSGDSDIESKSAMLLSMIPSQDVDQMLGSYFLSGRHQVRAVSVLLMRDSQSSKQVMDALRTSRLLVVNLPSANQQVARWLSNVNERSLYSYKVCEKCTES